MKAASVSEIKKELKEKNPNELLELCLRLARFKKENKELLTYLIYEADDEDQYIASIKLAVYDDIKEVNKVQLYYCKKNIRRILRMMDRFIRYSGKKQTEAELRLFFCRCLIENHIPYKKTKALKNVFDGQIKKVKNSLRTLHSDLKYDYMQEIEELESN